ncbi:MAG: hypothetical protein JJT96_19395, partial [Opitutales bacterium]|nr:hypothetical protein [Opitutales bacterium]
TRAGDLAPVSAACRPLKTGRLQGQPASRRRRKESGGFIAGPLRKDGFEGSSALGDAATARRI